jgi:hypothetical protein
MREARGVGRLRRAALPAAVLGVLGTAAEAQVRDSTPAPPPTPDSVAAAVGTAAIDGRSPTPKAALWPVPS